MAKRTLLPSERLVGRAMPPAHSHIDTVMSGFVAPDGTFRPSMNPDESWLKPAHLKARRAGWIRSCRFSIRFAGARGPVMSLWELTETGKTEALAARERRNAAEAARAEWCRDHQAALRAVRIAKKDAAE